MTPTVLVSQTAAAVVLVFLLTPTPNAATAVAALWALLVSFLAQTASRFRWIVEVACATTVIQAFTVTRFALARESASLLLVPLDQLVIVASLVMVGGALCATFKAVQALALIVLDTELVILPRKSAIALLAGLAVVVRFLYALAHLNVHLAVSATVHLILHNARAALTTGWGPFAKYLA